MFFLYIGYADADDLGVIQIDVSQPVIYCNISYETELKNLDKALKQGSSMTYAWEIIIQEERDYWLNKDIGSVAFQRQVVSDLLSRQWLLKDSSSGIASATLSRQKAIDFLTHLRHFPVIDKSLLQPSVRYIIQVKLYREEGKVSSHWWDAVTKFSDVVAEESFTLP